MKRFLSWLFWPKPKITKISEIEYLTLILINLLPIFGVLFFQWQVFPILLVYSIESMIGTLFGLMKYVRTQTSTLPKTASVVGYIGFSIVFTLFQVASLTVVLSITDQEQAWQSILNIYWGISVVIFIVNQIIFQIKKYQREKYQRLDQRRIEILLLVNYLSPFFLVILSIIIVKTGSYTLSMILLVLFKSFIEVRSYLRRHNELIKYSR
jgi:hypothetical protein